MKNARELWEFFIRYINGCDFTRTDGKVKPERVRKINIKFLEEKQSIEVGDFEVHRGK